MRDLRYAIRVLIKTPMFALTAILTLALCIGANTAIYTVVDRVLLRPLPYPHADRLAMVVRHYQGAGTAEDDVSQSGHTWVALREGAPRMTIASLGLSGTVNLVANGRALPVTHQRVSARYFAVLGIAPEYGREFTDEEDRPKGPAVAILSHSLWASAFNADPGVVGRSAMLRGEPHVIVGVMPAAFQSSEPVDVWTPLGPSPTGEGEGENYGIIARLDGDVSWPQATEQVAAATAAVARDHYGSRRFTVTFGIVPLQRGLTDETRRPLLILWAAVGIVLFIGCVNVAGLLMARGIARAPEIATRIALGGGRAAIVRQLLAESVVLAACGGMAGIAIGVAASHAFSTLLKDAFGVVTTGDLDARVFAVTAAIALCTSVVFGLLPALHASSVDLRSMLVEGGSHAIAGAARSWSRRTMVIAEVALGVVLLVGAGLLIRSFDHLMRQAPGFDATHVMTATLSLQDARYQTPDRLNQLFTQTLERMRSVPGVQNAAVALTLPYERALNSGFRWPGGTQGQMMNVTYVTPKYFDTLRIRVMRGRVFTDADAAKAAPVIVVNEAFVRRYSPDRDPVGRQMLSNGERTIVGVVGDIQTKVAFGNFGPVGAAPAAYVPAAQVSAGFIRMAHTWFSPSWFVRTAGPQRGVAAEMQRAVEAADPMLPFAKFRTLDDVRGEAVSTPRAQAVLLGALAGLAVLLAAVGLYGLVANSVAERTRELGIRMALGATTKQTLTTAALPGMALTAIGVLIGLFTARLAARTLQHLVWGVSVADPLTFAIAAVTVVVVASVAAVVPALRIVKLNPMRALRQS